MVFLKKIPKLIYQSVFGRSVFGQLVFPSQCGLCHEMATHYGFCKPCYQDLILARTPKDVCPSCALISLHGEVCGACQKKPPPYERLWAGYRYDFPLDTLLHVWKYQKRLDYSAVLQSLFVLHPPPWLYDISFDWVVPVPLSAERLLERGFNQSWELADALEKETGMPILSQYGIQRQHRRPQIGLDKKSRRRNIKGSFLINFDSKDKNILLLDDVVTTGATLSELAVSLRHKGAKAIYAWVLMRKQVKNN